MSERREGGEKREKVSPEQMMVIDAVFNTNPLPDHGEARTKRAAMISAGDRTGLLREFDTGGYRLSIIDTRSGENAVQARIDKEGHTSGEFNEILAWFMEQTQQ